jgi:hypothetical protein
MYIKCNTDTCSCNHCCHKKKSITYSEYMFVALGIQHAIHTHHTIFCGLPSLLDFSTLPHKWQDLQKSIEQKKCVLIFSTAFV